MPSCNLSTPSDHYSIDVMDGCQDMGTWYIHPLVNLVDLPVVDIVDVSDIVKESLIVYWSHSIDKYILFLTRRWDTIIWKTIR